jgi:hypothetical protein
LRDVVADAGAAASTKGAQMPRDAHHERLSSLDATFLGVEDLRQDRQRPTGRGEDLREGVEGIRVFRLRDGEA